MIKRALLALFCLLPVPLSAQTGIGILEQNRENKLPPALYKVKNGDLRITSTSDVAKAEFHVDNYSQGETYFQFFFPGRTINLKGFRSICCGPIYSYDQNGEPEYIESYGFGNVVGYRKNSQGLNVPVVNATFGGPAPFYQQLNWTGLSGIGIYGDHATVIRLQITGVPEASTWVLMILGFGAVGLVMRRRVTTSLSYA